MTDEKTTDATTVTEETDRTEVAVTNAGYADVPEGFVFVPGVTGDRELLKKLFAEVENPDDVIARPGYGYVIPEGAASALGLDTQEVTPVIDLSTPDSTPAEHALDTQDSPQTTNDPGTVVDDNGTDVQADGPLLDKLDATDPARNPDDEGTEPPVTDPEPTPATPAPVDPTATDPNAPAGDTTSTTSGTSKKTTAASAAS